jgi:threonine/homoserine/homoserine lactone efflux protein
VTEWLLGISLGLTAGVSPGPLMSLVITTTLQRGWRAGLTVAFSPLVTDAPIIVLCVLVLTTLPGWVAGVLGVGGGVFVVYLGFDTIRDAQQARLEATPNTQVQTQDLWRGALVNALSPHPWLFWLGVGAPILTKAMQTGWMQVIAFLVGFFTLLIGAKVLAAALVSRGRRWLTGPWYARVLILSGVLMLGLGVLLVIEGIKHILQPN